MILSRGRARLRPARTNERNTQATGVAMAFAVVMLAVGLGAASAVAQEGGRVSVLVLDASGSMWGQLDGGVSKIAVAREVMDDYFRTRDGGEPLGAIAYGHRRRGDCADIELLAPSGIHDATALSARLARLVPRGMTPIGESLRVAARQIPRDAERADIILVTDGLETCDADPCAVAAELAQEGVAIRAHVVGFGLTEQEATALACVTEQTGGLLLRPQSGAELAAALETIASIPATPAAQAVTLRNHFVFEDTGTGTPRGRMAWHAVSDTGETVRIGVTEGTQQSIEGIAAELPAGTWTVVAEGPEGRAERMLDLTACCGQHAVPFVGAPFAARIPPIADVQAGMAARLPYTITHAGSGHLGGTPYKIIATGPAGALTADQIVRRDLITARDLKTYGGATGTLAPGDYRLVIALAHDGEYRIVAEQAFRAVEAPGVRIVAQDQASPGESITLSLDGGYATAYMFHVVDAQDRDIGRGTALYHGAGGALALQLTMPATEGDFHLVVRHDKHIIARKPIRIAAEAAHADEAVDDAATTRVARSLDSTDAPHAGAPSATPETSPRGAAVAAPAPRPR